VFLFSLLLAVIYFIRDTILVFTGAIFFAYILLPVVGVVEQLIPRRRILALTVVYIVLVGALTGLGFALVPAIAAQATSLMTRFPALVKGGKLSTLPLPHFLEPMRAQVINVVSREAASLGASVVPMIQQAGTRIVSGVRYFVPLILIPILAFFFLKDGSEIRRGLVGSFDAGHDRRAVDLILDDIHDVLRSYIRALVLLAITAFICWIAFLGIMGYPYELLLAGLAALLEFIPVFGPLAALAAMLIVCAVTGSGGVLWIVIFWAIFRVAQDYIISPYLMSSGVEIHPLLVLFGVLAGENLAGIPGMFFSIPALAILKVIYGHLRGSYKRNEPFRSSAGQDFRSSTHARVPERSG
jgi:predicted PurR-regulated permease PerM